MKGPVATRDDYQPGAAIDADARRDGSRWTLVFVRQLRHAPNKVWLALTDSSHIREWAPFDADRNLESTGPVKLTMVGGTPPEAFDSEVRHAEAPRLLEYTWGDDVVLKLIARNPEVRAVELAAKGKYEKAWLKANIRKLKSLGLTESLKVGYRL